MSQKIKKITNKKNKSKIICLTAYSKNVAEALDNHTDIILIGDSLGSVLYNYNTTTETDCGDVGPEMRWFAIDIAIFEFRLAVW